MLRIKVRNGGKGLILSLAFCLFLLQDPLEDILSVFSYVDECFALLGFIFLVYNALSKGRLKIRKVYAKIIAALFFFVLAGLLGNFIYKYQNTTSVLIDLFTCLKFFLCIVVGYDLLRFMDEVSVSRVFTNNAKFWSFFFFILLVVDLLFEIFPIYGTRYGLRVIKFFYSHPTYLASAAVFLLTVLTLFYQRKNDLFILMALMVLFFTLRGKATAGTAVYILVYFFVLHQRKKIRVWHIILIGIIALLVAWDQFSFYYIDLENESARSLLTKTSFEIMKDYFPIGTGFGTYASSEAAKNYSQVYYLYGLSGVYGLTASRAMFASDTFWPIITGQTGVLGTICYSYSLLLLGLQTLKTRACSIPAYSCGIFVFAYLLISSTSESTFCNALSIPLAIVIGIILALQQNQKTGINYEET